MRLTQLEVHGEKKKMVGKQAGDGRLRSKSAEGNREEVQRQERYHSVKYWLLCLPALPLPAFSSPSFCSLSDQLLLIKIFTAALWGSPSSSLPIPPSLSASPVAMSLFFYFEDVLFLPVAINNLNTLFSPFLLIF